jgi:hypothetical protein
MTVEGNIPRETVVLPNIETLFLLVNEDGLEVYNLAAYISCPHAKYTSLMRCIFDSCITHNLEAFHNPVLLETIVRQYSTSPAEQVTLEIRDDQFMAIITYYLTFQSSNGTIIQLGFEVAGSGEEEGEFALSHEEMILKIFSQACRTIRDHPLLSHVKRLHIEDGTESFGAEYTIVIGDVVSGLFRSLGPLEELTIHGCDLRIFLAPYLPEFEYTEPVIPLVKELTISVTWVFDGQQCADAIVELAKSQHELEKPFERVMIRARGIPALTAKRLGQWVGTADCDV